MAVADLLMSQRRWGATRSRKIMALLPLSEHKTVGSLTNRQRGALAAVLQTGVTTTSGIGRAVPAW